MRKILNIFGICYVFLLFTIPFISKAEDGYAWTQTSAPSKQWNQVDVSDDGDVMVATEYQNITSPFPLVGPGDIYLSTDSGVNWAVSNQGIKREKWNVLDLSGDGSNISVAALFTPSMVRSTTTGATWATTTSAGAYGWSGIVSSSDGQRIIATSDSPVVIGDFVDGFVHLSTDGGVTWATSTGAGNKKWKNISASSDAMKSVAYVTNGYMYTSTNGGVTWATSTSVGTSTWNSVSMSGDGTKVIASISTTSPLYLSTDGGVTWATSTTSGSRNWRSVKISGDGNTMVAAVYGGYIYLSTDGGSTWVQQTSAGSRNWTSVSVSAGGEMVAATVSTGRIYTALFNDELPMLTDLVTSTTESAYTLSFAINPSASSTLTYELASGVGTTTKTSSGVEHDFNIGNLVPCTTYKYSLMVTNSFFKTATTSSTFTTRCSGNISPATSTQQVIATSTGGSVSLNGLTLTVPTNYATSSASFQVTKLSSSEELIDSYGLPDNSKNIINGYVYSLSALTTPTTSISVFNEPLTLSFSYTVPDDIDQNTLVVYRNDDSVWTKLDCSVDTNSQVITCQTEHFSFFALFGEELKNTSSFGSSKRKTVASNIETKTQDNVIPKEESQLLSFGEITSVNIDLEIGVKRDEVKVLQKFLNNQGFVIANSGIGSLGNETDYFGTLTQQALIKFQTANNIVPASGYFGPLTRGYIQAIHSVSGESTSLPIVSSENNNLEKDLTLGSNGSDVEKLQKILVKEGYLEIPSGVGYGYFGTLTQQALIKFQIANNIVPASGYFGEITRALILKLSN